MAKEKLCICSYLFTRSVFRLSQKFPNAQVTQRGNIQDAINANVVNGTHFPEQEMVRLFKGTCEAVRAMHTYRAPVGAATKPRPNPSVSRQQSETAGRHSDDDERFPQPEGDGDGGYSYDGASVPLVTRQRVEEEGEVIFEGDEDVDTTANGNSDPRKTELVPYAHRDLKPGYAANSGSCMFWLILTLSETL